MQTHFCILMILGAALAAGQGAARDNSKTDSVGRWYNAAEKQHEWAGVKKKGDHYTVASDGSAVVYVSSKGTNVVARLPGNLKAFTDVTPDARNGTVLAISTPKQESADKVKAVAVKAGDGQILWETAVEDVHGSREMDWMSDSAVITWYMGRYCIGVSVIDLGKHEEVFSKRFDYDEGGWKKLDSPTGAPFAVRNGRLYEIVPLPKEGALPALPQGSFREKGYQYDLLYAPDQAEKVL
jgi:hypothetical protein